MATGFFSDPLATKDVVTLLVSGAALVTSVSVALFNVYVHRSKKSDDARKAFEEAILGIAEAKQAFESLRKEAGKEFDLDQMMPRRISIVEMRNFNLSKALRAFKVAKFATTSHDNLLIGAALIDSGRRRASVPFYQRAVQLADDDFERAVAERVLGRAQLLAGDYQAGRRLMLTAAENFDRLSDNDAYEPARMRREVAETFRRLVEAALEAGVHDNLDEDLRHLESAAEALNEPRTITLKEFSAETKAKYLISEIGGPE